MWFSAYKCSICDNIFLFEAKGGSAKRCPFCGTTDEFDDLEGQDYIEVNITESSSNKKETIGEYNEK